MFRQALRCIPKHLVIRSNVPNRGAMLANKTLVEMSRQASFCTETVKHASVVESSHTPPKAQDTSNTKKNSHVAKAFERINLLCDKDTFTHQEVSTSENGEDFGITDQALIRGRSVQILYLSVAGNSLSEVHIQQLESAFQAAGFFRTPVVGIYDFRCQSIQKGKISPGGISNIFQRNAWFSGFAPQISLIFGPSLGAVFSLYASDFIFMVKNGYDTSKFKPGIAHSTFEQDVDCLKSIREFIHFLPLSRKEMSPIIENSDPTTRGDDALNSIISLDPNTAYNMKNIIRSIVDDENFCELMPDHARNILTGFARMNGQVVAIVANQPCETAGIFDYDSSAKAAKFVRFANTFNIPILTFVDVPGLLYEEDDVPRKGGELLFEYVNATVPRITIVTRKAHDDAYDVISSEYLIGKFNYSWAMTSRKDTADVSQETKSIYHSIEPSATRQRICEDLESLKTREPDQPRPLTWKEVVWAVRNLLLILFSLFILIRYVC